MMENEKILEALTQKCNGKILKNETSKDNKLNIYVAPQDLPAVIDFLKNEPGLDFDSLVLQSGVDRKTHLQSVYHLQSTQKKHWLVLKVDLPRENPEVPSLVPFYACADWQERETYDLFGIVYTGHPDLRRIFLPDDWEGWPGRRDYVEPHFKELTEKYGRREPQILVPEIEL